jgi:hypothetical protein
MDSPARMRQSSPLVAQVLASVPTQQDTVCPGTGRQPLDHEEAASRGIGDSVRAIKEADPEVASVEALMIV